MRKNEHIFYYTPENAFVKRKNGENEAKSLARTKFPEFHHRARPVFDIVPVADERHLLPGVGVVFLVRAGVDVAGNDVFAVLDLQQREAEAGEIGLRVEALSVTLSLDGDGNWLPYAVSIRASGASEGAEKLCALIRDELGIPVERQVWTLDA